MLVTVGVHFRPALNLTHHRPNPIRRSFNLNCKTEIQHAREVFIIHKLGLFRQFHIVKSRSQADGGSMPYAAAFLVSHAALTDAFGPRSVAPPVSRTTQKQLQPHETGVVDKKRAHQKITDVSNFSTPHFPFRARVPTARSLQGSELDKTFASVLCCS